MALCTPSDIRNMTSEFDSLTDPRVQFYIDLADLEINEDAWGSRAKAAEMLLTCHKMVVMGALNSGQGAGSSASGAVQAVSVGDVSVTYASDSASDPSDLNASSYGREYARMVRLAAIGGAVLNGC